jgi:N-acetyl-gamma-glutamyl-phosphate reductase
VPLHFEIARRGTDAAALHATYERHYADEPFIRVMPLSDPATVAEGFLDVQACNDTNRCDIFVFADAEKALLIARLDNLGKGASGAAIQAMNLNLGLDEGLGL